MCQHGHLLLLHTECGQQQPLSGKHWQTAKHLPSLKRIRNSCRVRWWTDGWAEMCQTISKICWCETLKTFSGKSFEMINLAASFMRKWSSNENLIVQLSCFCEFYSFTPKYLTLLKKKSNTRVSVFQAGDPICLHFNILICKTFIQRKPSDPQRLPKTLIWRRFFKNLSF